MVLFAGYIGFHLSNTTTGTTVDLVLQVYDVSQAPAAAAPATGETSQDDLMQVEVLLSPDGRLTDVQPVDWNRGWG